MKFINPIEILELENINISAIDNSIIKKAKRKLFANIDLSDNGHLDYKGQSITKTDCEIVIDELENSNSLEFYSHLVSNKLLNDFLVNGNERLFYSFKQEAIYKLPEFIKFISPFFAPKFDKAILKAFTDEDEEKLRNILRTQFLISQTDLNIAFKGLSIEIQNRIEQVDSITKEIKNEESNYSDEDISIVIKLVKKLFPIDILNQLPPYFQSQINKIAASINFLQLANWNEFGNSHVSLALLNHLLELNIESVSKPIFKKNYDIIKKRHIEHLEQERHAPMLKQWADILLNIRTIHSKIEESKIKPKEAFGTINTIPIHELNNMESFADEIRNSIAFMLRGISVSIWNIHHDIDIALKTIVKAVEINLSEENKQKLLADLAKLQELKRERDEMGEPLKSAPSLRLTNGSGTTIYGKTLYIVIFGIPILPLARYNCQKTYDGYRFFGKLKLHTWQLVWKYGLIGYVSFLIFKAIIMNN